MLLPGQIIDLMWQGSDAAYGNDDLIVSVDNVNWF
jgi:hypothetical protein